MTGRFGRLVDGVFEILRFELADRHVDRAGQVTVVELVSS